MELNIIEISEQSSEVEIRTDYGRYIGSVIVPKTKDKAIKYLEETKDSNRIVYTDLLRECFRIEREELEMKNFCEKIMIETD